MTSKNEYDVVVIGGGSGGISIAEYTAMYGKKCAIIEGLYWGGTCVNVGCVPKKLFWQASNTYRNLNYLKGWGMSIENKHFDWMTFAANREEKINEIEQWYTTHLQGLGVDCFNGWGKIKSKNCVEVEGKELIAEKIIIATGGKPTKPKNIPGAEIGCISDDIFSWKEQPKKVVIVGSGYIALEFAFILQNLGTQVTLVIRKDLPLSRFEPEIKESIAEYLKKAGVTLLCNSNVSRVTKEPNEGVAVHIDSGERIIVDQLVWAIGREPNTDGLSVESAGVQLKGKRVITDKYSCTNIDNVFAIGDVTDRPQLTPVAIQEGRRLIKRLLGNEKEERIDLNFVPTVVFTTPPIAVVGKTEEEAIKEGLAIDVYRSKFSTLSDSLQGKGGEVFMKLICEKESNKVIGIHMLGEGIEEILQGFAVALNLGATKRDFDKTIAIHPTIGEELITIKPLL